MPSSWKHRKTGVFYIRVKAPGAVRSKVTYETYQRTLGTKSLAEAKILFAEALTELNEEWARLLAEPGAPNAEAIQGYRGRVSLVVHRSARGRSR